jgi:uncharacterized protein
MMKVSYSTCSTVRIVAAALVALALAGCPGAGPRATAPPNADRAEILLRQGNPAEAARIFEALAGENTGDARNRFLLRSAGAWIAAGREADAERVIGSVSAPLAPQDAFEERFLRVELALLRDDAQGAWQALQAVAQPPQPPEVLRYLELRERVAFAALKPVEGVSAQIARERWMENPEERESSRALLLAELRDAAERGTRLDPNATQDRIVRGWLELGTLAASAARNPNATVPEIENWLARYPGHPAGTTVRRELLGQRIEAGVGGLQHVALLLPVSGRLASAGATVRDGFMTAWFAAPLIARPRIHLYDTGTTSIADALLRAAESGANFIVGPLTREEVIAAAEFQAVRVPTLALNFLPQEVVPPPQFFQYALSPEEEARQVAQRILADGHRRGIALVPEGDWGSRVLTAFRSELESGGGYLLADGVLESGRSDFSPAITQALGITGSRARHRRLEALIGNRLVLEPRRRQDIDFIFMPSPSATARLLRPQLRFHYAGNVPTYSTSDAYEPDPSANRDMDGLAFPDMPWMLGVGELTQSVRTATRDAWPTGGPRRNRLFAFGFDAYRLLEALRSAPRGGSTAVDIAGLTGRLTLDTDGRVLRRLDWAEMRNGEPRLSLPVQP